MSSAVVDRRDWEAGSGAGVLDRTLDLGAVTWAAVGWVGVVAVAIALRFARLDAWALAPEEARRAFDAWSLYLGRPTLPGQDLPETAPLFLLLQALSFFLFGTTDVTARLVPALAGLALVGLLLALRPFAGRIAALGMALLAAISPTLVYASRVATPEIVVAALSLLLVVTVLRAGAEGATAGSVRRWAAAGGVSVGALLAAGPSAITALLSLAAGVVVASLIHGDNAVRRGLIALIRVPGAALAGLSALVATLLTLFTRCYSDLAAIAGLVETIADWGRLLASGSGGTPTQFFLLALLLYEPLAVLLALVAVLRGRVNPSRGLGWPFLGGWFVGALVLWSFSTGRAPEHAVHVALPLVLLGGGVLGDLLAALDRRNTLRGTGGVLALALLGLIVGLVALAIMIGRIDTAIEQRPAILQAIIVALLVVAPLGYAVFTLVGAERAEGRRRQPLLVVLLVPSLLFAAYVLRSAVLLAFYRGDEGTELLAQRTPTAAVQPAIARIEHLARDVTVTQGSVRDTPGGRGLSIAVDGSVRWPVQWYLRDFPDLSVTDPGQALLADAQVVVAPDDTDMEEAGYTAQTYPWLNRVPPAYAAPDIGAILRSLVLPSRWGEGVRFLLYRDGIVAGEPETVAIGLDGELAARVYPTTGPFNLDDRPGAGSARGQFDQPLGVAAAEDGTIYVVDQGNARVQRYDADGDFVGIWGDEEGVDFARTENGLGPTGIDVGPDGLVYVADTWNHRVVVLGSGGDVIRELGGPAESDGSRDAADTGDDPAAVETLTERFFGPRDVAVNDDEIYVVDTGNERVQVFGIDGTFRRAWGGYGSEPDQLIEPVGIALGPDGLVYVADSGNARISLFRPDGAPVAQWPVDAWPQPDPGGLRPGFQPYLAFAPDGTLYASSSDTGSVEVFDRSGAQIDSIREVDGDPLQQPVGVAVAPDGSVLITDLGRDAVYRYEPEAAAPPVEIVPIEEPVATPPPVGAAPTTGPLPPPPGQG